MSIPSGQAYLTALGGMSEVGASSYLYEFPQGHLLIDAGLRQSTNPASPPNWQQLTRRPDWMILTHAHLDHVGALPDLIRRYPALQVYASVETCQMARIVLEDAAHIAKTESGTNNPYEAALRQLRPFSRGKTLTLSSASGNLIVHTRSAGHLIGAVSLRIISGELIIEHTGDFSFEQTPTTPKAEPPRPGAHVIVTESTYGDRDLPPRRQQISNMISQVGTVLKNGGRVLIPSFALGRAQDVSFHLAEAMRGGQLPTVPIYVDGLCREAARVAEILRSGLPAPASQHRHPFTAAPIEMVTASTRPKILRRDKPCVIIASSGMLSGGVSPEYAKEIASEDKSAIMLVGYQDPDSPGGRLRGAARGHTIELGNKKVLLRCDVTQVQLSGHADRSAIRQAVNVSEAHTAVLIHGDDQARTNLGRLLRTEQRSVIIAQNNDRITLSAHPQPTSLPAQPSAAPPRPRAATPKAQVQKTASGQSAAAPVEPRPAQKSAKVKAREERRGQQQLSSEDRQVMRRTLRALQQNKPAPAIPNRQPAAEPELTLLDQELIQAIKSGVTPNSETTPNAPLTATELHREADRRSRNPKTRAEIKAALKAGLAADARSRRRRRREEQRNAAPASEPTPE